MVRNATNMSELLRVMVFDRMVPSATFIAVIREAPCRTCVTAGTPLSERYRTLMAEQFRSRLDAEARASVV